MPQRLTVVDAFTDRPFAGNPAAVCITTGPVDDRWMRDLAREMNLSETAFLHPLDGRDDRYSLRWLTPSVEVDLCGHATLASAHVLWQEGHAPSDGPLEFLTRSGPLSASRNGPEIELDFPALTVTTTDAPDGLAAALGTEVMTVSTTGMDLLVEVGGEAAVRGLSPDLSALARLPVRGVIVTSLASSPGFDFVSRFFAPQSGVPEDPVTGSAHCALAPFWGDRLGKAEMIGYQASPRGGTVRVSRHQGRVKLGGRAVTVWRGELVV
jgi:PhzF family phenazine biosynthesis protein